ncbi:MAG: hypothetical protein JW950_05795 [Deltaproteobacteria bacterium]|nr:hypothetical protein [Deltaproteobacteria bacterium]
MNPENIMEGLSNELEAALKGMSNAKTVADKVAYSQVVKNLCESMGVFLSLANDIMEDYDIDDEE